MSAVSNNLKTENKRHCVYGVKVIKGFYGKINNGCLWHHSQVGKGKLEKEVAQSVRAPGLGSNPSAVY